MEVSQLYKPFDYKRIYLIIIPYQINKFKYQLWFILNMGTIKITMEGFLCERCGYKWIPRNKEESPRVCPKCKSPYWDKPKKKKS